jgi:hypothetical protein
MRTIEHEQLNRVDSAGYEFSFRPSYGTRLFVQVPKASLDVFRRGSEPAHEPLSLLVKHDRALRALAIARSQEEQTNRVVVTETNAESILRGVTPGRSS